MTKRPPIVVVMGHVDHGKTTLLDFIRKSRVAEKEAGGITQSIGAYEIEHPPAGGQKITFIDTPGHEAFIKMRSRGAGIADLAILVVAADDSVQQQTKEALGIIQETKTPFIVAITKADRVDEAQITKVKNDLMQIGILLEGYGGNVSWKVVSAKTGVGINELLDLILLAAELEDLKYEPQNPARGYIIEARKDSRRGVLATAIITDGGLKIGDLINVGGVATKIRGLENFLGKRIDKAQPAMPAQISGFKEVPAVGGEFVVGTSTNNESLTNKRIRKFAPPTGGDSLFADAAAINVILKADTTGSLEALSQVIQNLPLPPGHQINIMDEGIGDITDGDVKWNPQVIIGFRVEPNPAAENLAKSTRVKIITSEIIYELIKTLEDWIKSFGAEAIIGELEILAIFDRKGGRQIIGGKVIVGEVRNNSAAGLQREGSDVGVVRVINLQQQKQDVQRVEAGNECGLLVEGEAEIRVGDHLIFK